MKHWQPFLCPRCGNILMLREPAPYICPMTGEDVEKEEVEAAMQKAKEPHEPLPTYH